MKPRHIDPHIARLEEVAEHVIEVPAYKVLAEETGIPLNYLKNLMSRLIRIKRTGSRVPRETLLRSLCSEKEFDSLIARLQSRGGRRHLTRAPIRTPEEALRALGEMT